MDKLVDVIPSRLRFSTAAGAHATRNILIRNVAITDVPLEVEIPGPPFYVQKGAERLKGRSVTLCVGEVLPLQIALDHASITTKEPFCEFLVVRVELCRPTAVDLVAAADSAPEDVIRRLVEHRRAEVPGLMWIPPSQCQAPGHSGEGYAAARLEDRPVPSALAGYLGEHCAPSAANELDERTLLPSEAGIPSVAFGATMDDRPVPAALAEFLGTLPAPSALARHPQRAQSPAGGGASAARTIRADRDRQRGSQRRNESPPSRGDTPPTSHRQSSDCDDDRPPTPTPADFARVAVHQTETEPPVGNRQKRAPPAPFEDSAPAGEMCTALNATRPPPVPDTEESQPKSGQDTRSRPRRSDQQDGRPRPGPRSGSRESCGVAAVGEIEPTTLTPQPTARDDSFYVEGVGWCDAYGRVIPGNSAGCAGGEQVSRVEKRSTSCPRPSGPSGAVPQGSRRSAAAAPVAGKPPRCSRSSGPDPKVHAKQLLANWEGLGVGV
eukprot:gnl/TRDRNA2_/TRDRNA2_142816_c0_seq3.p1 gnl/TRDRNA2_/TRDRNA2_142816_c0~~gnl/TRDRNA2_/TRDRNA2_142816_c0_seq3.p1  ORF type:complete len:495 (+),score=57.04 gnl/TRDRNA2_/TRDRNA2_142816_c0_seq3:101-1585(+)